MFSLILSSASYGAAPHRSMPELSDIALFACAVAAIWFVRRALRARFRKNDVAD